MNGPHTQVFLKDNRFVRLMDRIAEQNAMDGKPAGRSTEQFMNAAPLIPAKRAGVDPKTGIARGQDYVPPPLEHDQDMAASARATAMGIHNFNNPSFDDDMPGDIGHVASDPTDREIDEMLARAKGQPMPGADAGAAGAAGPVPVAGPAPAGRPVALPRGAAMPVGVARQMPNFANVEGFDLTRKVAVVDGMEFQLADVDVVAMKKFAIQVVLDNVTYQLAQALVALGIPAEMAQATADKMRETVEVKSGEAVQPVQGREAARGLLPGPNDAGRSGAEVQGVQEGVERQPSATPSSAPVQPDPQGGGEQPSLISTFARPSDDASLLLGDGDYTPE